MSTYVMSDIHGNYRAYKAMLEKINFNREDMLYILGDILDRGPNPIRIILDLMERFNVEVIAGNHCVMACECLAFLTKEITSESIAEIDEEMIQKLLSWQQNGGISTTDEFHKCSREMQREIVDFISDFELYDEIEVNGQKFVLVHAGLGNFMPNKELWKYELNDLIWERPDYEKELEESMKTIEEGDILTGTVISVDEKEVILDLKYYAEGVIPAENYSREPGFSLKDEVHEGDEVSATVVRKDDGQGNILLSRVEAVDVLAWDKLKELKESGEVLDVVVKGITNAGVIAYVEGVRGFIPASKLALNYVEDTEEYLNKPIQVQVLDVDKESKKLILSAKEILRAKAEEERKNKVSNLEIGLVTEGTVESLQPYGAFVNLGNGLSGLVHISQICEKRIKKPSEVLAVGDTVKVKVTAIKDGKLSLSIKEATDMMAKEIEEEVYEVPDAGEQATTSLGSLFANIKLD